MDVSDPDMGLSQVAGAIAEPARTRMLCALMDGHARTSTELAVIAQVGASTASAHMARLKEDGLLRLHVQGRHRYYSLANTQVAAAIEALMVISPHAVPRFVTSTPDRLQFARTCYDHMAGILAVQLHDFFFTARWFEESLSGDCMYRLTAAGERGTFELGLKIDVLASRRRRFACGCLDWSMRRPHLAGALGAALLQLAIAREWLTQDLDSRALGVTPKGRKAFASHFDITF